MARIFTGVFRKLKPWPSKIEPDIGKIVEVLRFMLRSREDDVSEMNNLNARFMSGRKVGKTPISSSDIASTDRIGDFNYSSSYFYICVDNSGSAEWRRISLGSW